MRVKVGDRVGAILFREGNNIHLIGYGVYDGEQKCPIYPFGITKAQYRAAILNAFPDITEAELENKMVYKNPRITLDNDKGTVFGMECWWGDEATIKSLCSREGMTVIDVPVSELPSHKKQT